ncbi:MAG: DUF4358 domain-containing protein [Faecalibacterium sp.]|nr:DUF4358 domain-containing protein [Ruminococcus sp.]MCM1392193.1 DUF4358 domain-containing protein [Ruminococcus sp.]MCM1485397.1 DUF4358 domain-containing protein [Faecalibacterium sp.]
MSSERVKEIFCVLLLGIFIFLLTGTTKVSDKTAEEVYEQVSKIMDVSELQKCSNSKIKKEFGIDANSFDGIVYMASDSVMDVREILLVRLKDENQAEALTESIESRIKDKTALFKGYAPEESALLDSYILKKDAGFILFAVCSNPDAVYASFKKAV